MARRVQTLINQITVPGYGLVPVAGTSVIIADVDFQRIAPSFFSGTYPKLKDLGAIDSPPDQSATYATQQELAGLVAQLTALSDDVNATKAMTTVVNQKATTAQQTAVAADTNATSATATASDAAETADAAHSVATTAQTQAVTASSFATQATSLATQATQTAQTVASRVTTLEGNVQSLTDSLSAFQGSLNNKENTGVAAGLLANHTAAADPHQQYQNQARADSRYAALAHQHMIADVSGLQAALDGKDSSGVAASAMSTHLAAADPHSQYLNKTRADVIYSALGHQHVIADITSLQTSLNGKENSGVAASLLAAHVAASDPHVQYLTTTRGNTLYATVGAVSTLQTAVTALQAKSVTIQQPAAYTVPAISLGGTTSITVTWPSSMPHTDYGCVLMFDMGATLVGGLTAALVPSSRTITGCQVTVKSSILLTLGQAKLTVTGIAV